MAMCIQLHKPLLLVYWGKTNDISYCVASAFAVKALYLNKS